MKSNCTKGLLIAAALTLTSATAHIARAGYDEGSTTATDSMSSNMSMSSSEMRAKNAQMLMQTLSEEKTEINALAAQQAKFRAMGDMESLKIARLWGVWIRQHKAAGPALMKLIRMNGGDPMAAKVLKAPVLGTKDEMLMATHRDHQAAVMSSQMRFAMTNSEMIKTAMNKRANLARKHLRQMMPYHNMDMHDMDKM